MRRRVFFCCWLAFLGCSAAKQTRQPLESPPDHVQATVITYAESEAFDLVLESALLRQEPVLDIPTGFTKPEWGPTLNAWIAAWNKGGQVANPTPAKRTVRSQSPFLSPAVLSVNEGVVREFRLLITLLMDRAEDRAKQGVSWWEEEKTRNRRIALLKPYNLRFHMDETQQIHVILFNGKYASYHEEYMMQANAEVDDEEGLAWSRSCRLSHCKSMQLTSQIKANREVKPREK